MLLNKSDVQDNTTTHTFYSPISKYGYLTPEQRRKLREKRNLNLLPVSEFTNSQLSKSKSSIKKSKQKIHSKSKLKIQTKELLYKKIKPNLPQVRCTAAQLIGTKKNDSIVNKKFFKTRSPEHFKKANFVVPLVYKRSRLDFNSSKHSYSDSNHSLQNISESGNDFEFSKSVEKPTIIYVFPVQESGERSDILSSDPDENGQSREKLLVDIQQSFMENSNLPELVSQTDCSENSNDSECSEELSGSDCIGTTNGFDCIEKPNDSDCIGKSSVPVMDSKISDPKEIESPKFYPIFYKQKAEKIKPESTKERSVVKKTFCSKDTSKGSEQMIIDAGQKEIGAKECKTCNMIYSIGQEEDEKLHSNYHDMYLVNLRFPGWKNEYVVGHYEDGRVIKVTKDDSKKLKKIQEILLIANRDLGFPSNEIPERPNLTFLLFISNDKKVKGCLVAESITSASPIVLDEDSDAKDKEEKKVIWEIGSWYASSQIVPAVCGINRIWVARDYRRHKVASRLIDCLRSCFIFGHFVSLQELAFTDPSPDGRTFAAHYTGTDNFLVYR